MLPHSSWGVWNEISDAEMVGGLPEAILDLRRGRRTDGAIKAYYASVQEQLPPQLAAFKARYSLHDAVLRRVELEPKAGRASIVLLIGVHGDRGREEVEGTLVYTGLEALIENAESTVWLPGPGGHGDLGYDEVEVLGSGLFEHRMLFSSGIEFAIRFAAFHFKIREDTDAPA